MASGKKERAADNARPRIDISTLREKSKDAKIKQQQQRIPNQKLITVDKRDTPAATGAAAAGAGAWAFFSFKPPAAEGRCN